MRTGLPSSFELIPNLGVLDKLLREKTPVSEQSKVNRHTEQLAYYLRGACHALNQLENTRICAANQFTELADGNPRSQWIIAGDLWDEMGFSTDLYLACLRRACDALLHYVSRCPRNISLPESFKDFVDGIRNRKYQVDSKIGKSALNYWDETGIKVKGYRDQALHKAVILSNCLVFYHHVTGSVGLRMSLPDNPQEKSPAELKYEPGVAAMRFFVGSLYDTIQFVNVSVERMIDLMAPFHRDVRETYVISASIRGGPIIVNEMITDGEPVPFSVTVHDVVRRAAMDKT